MNKKKLILSTALLFAFTLTSCGGSNDSSVEIDSNYTYKDEDLSNEPLKDVETIRFHYRRSDDTYNNRSSYKDWGIWGWDMSNGGNGDFFKFDYADKYGVYVDIPLTSLSTSDSYKDIGFIVALITKSGNNYKWYNKDPDSDRSVDVSGQDHAGIKEIYLMTKNTKIYYNSTDPLKPFINYARVSNDSLKTVLVSMSYSDSPIEIKENNLSVNVNGNKISNYKIQNITSNTTSNTVSFNIVFDSFLKLTDEVSIEYKFDSDWIDSTQLMLTSYFDSNEFIENYAYDGDDLGVSFDDDNNPTKTTFKVWAPTSNKLKLNIYETSDYRSDITPSESVDMILGDKGVWSYTFNKDLSNKYYTYSVTNIKGTNEISDPYAKSAGLNGRRGMIVNFAKLNQEIAGWNQDKRPEYGNPTDATIYEIHVRDMTINPNSNVDADKRGKFLGLAQEDTYFEKDNIRVSTGLSHLKDLGISHVQIQPFYDYNSVDESLDNKDMSKINYNWGYDPQNYNVLEGSYSSNPIDGAVRIKEFKQMVMAMHKAGININMDVVYNHTGSTDNSNFQLLVPNYYYRTSNSGTFYNGSGCGNEVASNRYMGRKFILDSVKFWTEEYHMSGYRFDLMGLEDNQTMIDVYNEVTNIYDKALVYGEPWTGGTSKLVAGTDSTKLSSQTTIQSSLYQNYFVRNNVLVGAFNDIIRNAVRGDNGPGKGYVQGVSADAKNILSGIEGKFTRSDNQDDIINKIEPSQVINYVSCHDNYTLYDQLIQTMSGDIDNAYIQAEAIILTSQGIAFMQEGEDFKRSKAYELDGTTKYEGNSYNVGDFINNMDYELKATNKNTFDKFVEMINLRKNTEELTLSTRAEINEKLTNLKADNGLISYKINNSTNGGNDLMVIHSLTGASIDVGEYENILFTTNINNIVGTTLVLNANQTVILSK